MAYECVCILDSMASLNSLLPNSSINKGLILT